MKANRRDPREHLDEYPNDEIMFEYDFIEICWEDALNKGIRTFWESIDEEEID